MELCKSHKECFEKICSLCEDYEPLSSHAVLGEGPAYLENEKGITIRELKEYINGLPEKDDNGNDFEVWIETGKCLSSPVVEIIPLNAKDNGHDIELISRAFA